MFTVVEVRGWETLRTYVTGRREETLRIDIAEDMTVSGDGAINNGGTLILGTQGDGSSVFRKRK